MDTSPLGGGGGLLPYMCCCEGYGFQAVWSVIGYRNQGYNNDSFICMTISYYSIAVSITWETGK